MKNAKISEDSANYNLFKAYGASKKNTTNDISIRSRISDSLCNNNLYYKQIFAKEINYWIIDIAKDSLIGQLSAEEYLSKRKQLGVPQIVILKFE